MAADFSLFMRLLRSQLTSFRLDLNLTLREAAQRALLSRGGLEKIESGENLPSLESLYNICKVYGISLSEFFNSIEIQKQLAANSRANFQQVLEKLSKASLPAQTLNGLPEKDLKQQIFSELACEAGLEEEMKIACELVSLQKKNKDLFNAISATIHCLVADRRKSKPASALKEIECPKAPAADHFA